MKKLKPIALLLIAILTAFITNVDAQVSLDDHSIIFTKNGSILKGSIVEYEQGKQLKLQMKNGTIITLNDKKVKKIYSSEHVDKFSTKKKFVLKTKDYAFAERGIYASSTLPITLGFRSWNNVPTLGYGVHQSLGFQFQRLFGAGIGVGFDAYYPSAGQQFIPVYAEARGYLIKEWISPMYSIAAGYGFIPSGSNVNNNSNYNLIDKQGGLYVNPSLGFRFGASKNANFTLDFGVKFQQGKFVYNEWGGMVMQEAKFQRFTLKTGLLF